MDERHIYMKDLKCLVAASGSDLVNFTTRMQIELVSQRKANPRTDFLCCHNVGTDLQTRGYLLSGKFRIVSRRFLPVACGTQIVFLSQSLLRH
jgi:hypothetical protein